MTLASTSTLTDDLRVAMRDALTADDLDSIARNGATGYLRLLDATPNGAPLGDLIDVIEYFRLDPDA